MALKSKDPAEGASPPQPRQENTPARPGQPMAHHGPIKEEVEARLNPYIEATQDTYQRYLKTATENPERAARLLSLKDLDSLMREHRLSKNEIDGAKLWLSQQPKQVQDSIAQRHAEIVHPAMKDLKILELVLNRRKFETKMDLRQHAGKSGAGVAA